VACSAPPPLEMILVSALNPFYISVPKECPEMFKEAPLQRKGQAQSGTLEASTLITLFVKMLRFLKINIFFKDFFFFFFFCEGK
jgi:hypothetical protein